MVRGILKVDLCLRDWYDFMGQSGEISKVFNALTLKQIVWKTKTFFKKLEYCFLVESTKTESASFLYKTARSEANVNPIQDDGVGAKMPPTSISPVNTTNVGISP